MAEESIFKYRDDYEYKQQNWFKITILKDDVINSEDIYFYVQNCDLPTIQFNATEAHVGNFIYRAAGKPDFGSTNVSFTDSLDDKVASYFYDWQREIFNPETGVVGRKKNYGRTMKITEIKPDGSSDPDTIWTFYAAWPSNINYGQLDYSSGERREISVEMSFDYAERGY